MQIQAYSVLCKFRASPARLLKIHFSLINTIMYCIRAMYVRLIMFFILTLEPHKIYLRMLRILILPFVWWTERDLTWTATTRTSITSGNECHDWGCLWRDILSIPLYLTLQIKLNQCSEKNHSVLVHVILSLHVIGLERSVMTQRWFIDKHQNTVLLSVNVVQTLS